MAHLGFTDVDASERRDDLVDYLVRLARKVAVMRGEDYRLLRLRPGASVLDVGCGAGEVCAELAVLVGPQGRVSGIDASETMIAAARRTVEASGNAVDLRVASVYCLPYEDASFDAVRAERVFQHLHDPEAGLREMLRVLRPGGRVLVFDPDHSQAGMALDDAGERRVFEASLRAQLSMHANPFSGTRLRGMFVRAGLIEVEQVVRSVELPYADFVHALGLQDRLALAVDKHDVTPDEARRFVASLEARDRAGTFFASAIAYSVAGTKG